MMHLGEIALMALFGYRFRSPERDKETDRARVTLVRKTVHNVIDEAHKEAAGLRKRLESARLAASALAGNDVSDGAERDDATEQELRSAELRLRGAEMRIGQINSHLDDLRKIEAFLDQVFSAEPPKQ